MVENFRAVVWDKAWGKARGYPYTQLERKKMDIINSICMIARVRGDLDGATTTTIATTKAAEERKVKRLRSPLGERDTDDNTATKAT